MAKAIRMLQAAYFRILQCQQETGRLLLFLAPESLLFGVESVIALTHHKY